MGEKMTTKYEAAGIKRSHKALSKAFTKLGPVDEEEGTDRREKRMISAGRQRELQRWTWLQWTNQCANR